MHGLLLGCGINTEQRLERAVNMTRKPVEGSQRMEIRPHRKPDGEVVPWHHRVGSNKDGVVAPRSETKGISDGIMSLSISESDNAPVDPVAVDSALSEAYQENLVAKAKIASIEQSLHQMSNDKRVKVGREWVWQKTLDEVLESGPSASYNQSYWNTSLERLEQAHQKVYETDVLAGELNAEWEKNGRWSRFFLVTNPGGHIHSSMSCSTCYPTTEFAWLPEVSGQSEAEAVDNYGGILCSVCFPSAPVEWTEGVSKADQEAKDERERQKRERQAAKLAKALMPDGEPLLLPDTKEKLKTQRSAELWLSDSYDDFYGKNDERHKNDREVVLDALSQKTGKSRDELLAETQKRVTARRKREGRA